MNSHQKHNIYRGPHAIIQINNKEIIAQLKMLYSKQIGDIVEKYINMF